MSNSWKIKESGPILFCFAVLLVSVIVGSPAWASEDIPVTSSGYQLCNGAYTSNSDSFAEYIDKAKHGDAAAQNLLGLMYFYGTGIKKDNKEAVTWIKKSADHGCAEAQYNLAQMYYLQIEAAGNQDYEALAWFIKAADQGKVEAQVIVGMMYLDGEGTPVDYNQSFVWLEKAANNGSAMAQNQLGIMYESGKGVSRDDSKAILWYQKASGAGYRAAQNNLDRIVQNKDIPVQNSQIILPLDISYKEHIVQSLPDENKNHEQQRYSCDYTREQCIHSCSTAEMIGIAAVLAGTEKSFASNDCYDKCNEFPKSCANH